MIRSAMCFLFVAGAAVTAFAQREVGRIIPYDPTPLPEVRIPAEHPRV